MMLAFKGPSIYLKDNTNINKNKVKSLNTNINKIRVFDIRIK